ncbi:glycosyltransferase family 4 protein [Arthrobacter sp. CAN_A6]|uniref:glycosyltransferase family 4 protein n=1 Tax=Arthrobacter sp. CAN_A6 TaxID=2787721 RepID=UPI0018CB0CFF
MTRLIGNLRLAASTAATHLSDDPVLLAIQLSRRLPSSVVCRAAGAAARIAAVRGLRLPVVEALAAHLLGDTSVVESVAAEAVANKFNGGSARRLAEVTLAAGMLDETDRLLAAAGSGRKAAGLRARRRWYDGDMSGAVQVLREAGRNRHADRLAGELRVFEGWMPTLSKVKKYEPGESTVLHLLTNSLPHTGSGYAQRTHSLLKAQREAGWTVHAATRIGYPIQVGKLFAEDLDVLDGVSYHRLLPVPMAKGFDGRLQQQAEELLKLALALKPAVLHTTTHFVNGIVVEQVAHALGIPWVYEVRGQLADTWASTRPRQAQGSERYKLFTDREAQVMRNASLVVTLGEAMKQGIMRSGVPQEKILLSPNAIGGEYLEEPLSAMEARRRLGLPESGVFVGTVSSLVEYEGLDTLLRAVARLVPTHRELHCLIVGDGAAAPSLKALASELGIAVHVTFTGRVPREMARLHHLALDIFVVPRTDSDVTRSVTPLKPVEAMACARPVIASDLPALREIVEDGLTGVLIPAGSCEALVAEIDGLIDRDGARLAQEAVALGANGRRRVLMERTWVRSASTLSLAYEELECSA